MKPRSSDGPRIGLRFSSAAGLGSWGLIALQCALGVPLQAQTQTQGDLASQVQQMAEAVARAQEQVNESQRQLQQMRQQLADLRNRIAMSSQDQGVSEAQQLAKQVDVLKEQQAVQESQIATHEQSKVESESKYPVKLTGLILLNGFVNTNRVDLAATPTIALPGLGSTGGSLRQTVLGVDARGPHLFGARTHADLRVDFFGTSTSTNAGVYGNAGLLRLRTAHAALHWDNTEAFFSLDKPIINPDSPTSLTAVAISPLAWSGNLWSWNPQVGVAHDLALTGAERLRVEAALIDVSDPPVLPGITYDTGASSAMSYSASTGEQSRWPGAEAHVSILAPQKENGFQLGAGGFFAKHRTSVGAQFDAWAATLNYRQPLPGHLQISGNFYRGLGLGGLGGGAYKDFGYAADPDHVGHYYVRAFDDTGGWAELKERAGERFEFNTAFGIDNVPAGQLQYYTGPAADYYQNLARNRSFTGNVIYSPSSYLLFSVEYRRLDSYQVNAPAAASNIIGIAAGYKF